MNSAKTEDITKFRPYIFAAVRKVAGNQVASDEMEDLVQDVYLELLSDKLDRFDPDRGMELSTYVTMVASRHTIDKMRRLRKTYSLDDQGRHYTPPDTRDNSMAAKLATEQADDVASALEGLIKQEHGERLRAAIEKMPKGDQEFLARLMDDDYSTEDHAAELGISANAVYVKKCRLVAKLRAKLQK